MDMVRGGQEHALSKWRNDAETSEIASFARGLRADQDAVAAALREPWSNGQTEGQITKLKLIKRHVWTVSALQGDSFVTQRQWVQSCVRPVCAALYGRWPRCDPRIRSQSNVRSPCRFRLERVLPIPVLPVVRHVIISTCNSLEPAAYAAAGRAVSPAW